MSNADSAQITSSLQGALAGLRVIDLTGVVLGPYATQILGDYGADVIKIEPPSGDIMRHAGPMKHPGMGHIFINANRNKRSVVLDLKKPEQREQLLALCTTADVQKKATATLMAVLAKPEVREKIQGVGIDLDVEDSATLAKTIDAEIKKWGGWVKSAGITPE